MQRLLRLEKELTASNQPLDFEGWLRSSTIDKQELKEVVYGPNWKWRETVLDLIRNQREIYPHFHLTEADRNTQRQKGA